MFRKYFASIKEMQGQLFHVLAIAACVANLFGILLNAFLHGLKLPTMICIACGIALLILSIYGICTSRKGWATVGILIIVVWIEFPYLFSVYKSVILVYFILSIVGITIFFPRQFSVPFCVITILWDIAVIILTHFFPGNVYSIREEYMVLFIICSYVIVAVSGFVLLNFVILRYEKQKEELSEMNRKLDYEATHDPLTKLYNRGYLIEEIQKRISRDNTSFIAVIMDIDDFKKINDTYGHFFGDTVLQKFAELMEREVEGKGFAARFGGEEFMIIYDDDNRDVALKALHNIAEQLEAYYRKEKDIKVTFSGGLELYSSKKKIDELIINADRKLYQAKQNGKNQVIC